MENGQIEFNLCQNNHIYSDLVVQKNTNRLFILSNLEAEESIVEFSAFVQSIDLNKLSPDQESEYLETELVLKTEGFASYSMLSNREDKLFYSLEFNSFLHYIDLESESLECIPYLYILYNFILQ